MATLLLIETATDVCSLALSRNGQLLALHEADEPYVHATQITLLIEACCTTAGISLSEIDAVALSGGPGSYTALRVGASVAKGICYALDKPLIALDTLLLLAGAARQEMGAETNYLYVPMIDARRMEVYTAIYTQTLEAHSPLSAKIIDQQSFSELFSAGQHLVFCGNGAPKCQEILSAKRSTFLPIICSAQHLLPFAEAFFQEQNFVDSAYFSPTYFKAPNITTPKKIL